jgi:predicted DNA binding CopG/RHH family protein
MDYSTAKRVVFPNLNLSTKTISIRLPESLIEHLKLLANKRDVPYQSLLKIFLSEKAQVAQAPWGVFYIRMKVSKKYLGGE